MLISRNVMRVHYRICERAEIKPRVIIEDKKEKTVYDGVGFHALRHTFAIRLLEKNVNIKIINDLLGHKDIQTTLNIYTHVTVDAKKEVGNVINSIYNNMTN
jgi:integrase